MARGLKFEIKSNSADLRQAVQTLSDLGLDPATLLTAWGGVLEASTRNRFDTGKGPGGVPWPPSKRVLKYGGKTLVDKGNLERSLRFEVQPHALLIGFDGASESVKNAAAHQFGVNRETVVVKHTRTISQAFGVPLAHPVTVTVRGHTMKMNLPARPMLGVDDQDKEDLRAASLDLLKGITSR